MKRREHLSAVLKKNFNNYIFISPACGDKDGVSGLQHI